MTGSRADCRVDSGGLPMGVSRLLLGGIFNSSRLANTVTASTSRGQHGGRLALFLHLTCACCLLLLMLLLLLIVLVLRRLACAPCPQPCRRCLGLMALQYRLQCGTQPRHAATTSSSAVHRSCPCCPSAGGPDAQQPDGLALKPSAVSTTWHTRAS